MEKCNLKPIRVLKITTAADEEAFMSNDAKGGMPDMRVGRAWFFFHNVRSGLSS